jgi:osmoprotectant transport system permease protein
VDPALVEAGTALGMTPQQLLRLVQLPLALPSIVAGIRVAAVIGVATATIAAAVGAGGLGEYIFRGLSMVDPTVILAGAIPSAVLALLLDGGLTLAERAVQARLGGASRRGSTALLVAAVASVAIVGWLVVLASRAETRVRVGSKNFTEQVLLGELVSQVLESRGVPVERRLNLGGTFICDRAIRSGDIDLYVEYTGTAHTAIFKQAPLTDSRLVLEDVRRRYAEVGVSTFEPLGFENTFAILVRAADADRLGLRSIADAASHTPDWRAGFGYEFLERADGYRGLAKAYGLAFRDPPRAMDLSLIYRALSDRQVDLIAGDATSGLIDAYGLRMLDDNRRYFPPYDAVVVARTATLLAQPTVRAVLEGLSGTVSVGEMRAMNRAVDVDRRDAAEVVRPFLRQ